MDNKIILSFHDSVLYSSDLKILKSSKEWLNDRIISFYFEYLSRNIFDDGKILLIGPEVTQAIKLTNNPTDVKEIFLNPLNCDSRNLIIFAVNDSEAESNSGTHWSLCAFSRVDNKFFHFDSLGVHNHYSCMKLVSILMEALEATTAEVIQVDCLQQNNSYDCGIFVLCHADEVCLTYMKRGLLAEIKKIKPGKVNTKRSELLEIIENIAQSS